MKAKVAVIIVELVDESVSEADEKIAGELMEWFRQEAVAIPWVRDVKGVTVKEA